ncbi:hypothetical protein FF1_021033 [Malus domestica]|nr:cyclic dof factor 2-like [Malus domestica]
MSSEGEGGGGHTIKLFGKTIPLAMAPLNRESSSAIDEPCGSVDHDVAATACGGGGGGAEDCSETRQKLSSSSSAATNSGEDNLEREGDAQQEETKSGKELAADKQDADTSDLITEDLKAPTTSSGISENPKTPSADRETSCKNGDQSETSSSQDKTLKKPDKILPCPRCNSMDTKFCYYNNYNVNQPRHFCKNCQRYWTAGGIMRNVPVGAGRRKNKNSSASQFHHVLMSDAFQAAHASAANGVHNATLGSNGTVLNFGSDSPLCESMASVLNLAEKNQNCMQNGFRGPEQRLLVSPTAGDNGDDRSSGSSITASNSTERGGKANLQEPSAQKCQSFPPQVPCFPGSPWPYPCNSAQWASAMPPPGFCHSGFPMAFYPAPPYWGCTVPGSWNVPCLSPSSTLSHCTTSSGPNSPTLGKHSRDEDIPNPSSSENEEPAKDNSSERCVWIPKTLRIDDSNEAARSSAWATLGIRNERGNCANEGGGHFKAFQSKGDEKTPAVEASRALQSNPAAFSRSLNFHERT